MPLPLLTDRDTPGREGRGAFMYLDFDNGLARERAAQMRMEVARNRLESRSATAARSDVNGGARRGRVARGAAILAALFGAHQTS